jgi:phosphoglycolate phosphatase
MIDAALGEGDGVPRKPDPTMLRLVISELGSSASRTMYIGDSPTDVECAIGAGTFSGAVTWGYHQPEDFATAGWVPDVMLDDPLDILRFA